MTRPIPAGSTRYPLPSKKTTVSPVPTSVVIGLGALAGGLGIVLPIAIGISPGLVLPLAVGSFAVGLVGVMLLPAAFQLPFIALFLLAGSGGASQEDAYAVPAVITFASLGAIIGSNLRRARIRRRRIEAAQGAPPAGLDPTTDVDMGRLALWDDFEYQYERVDYDADFAVSLVRELDGHARSGVTFFHGKAQLDVGGDAAGDMVVLGLREREATRWQALVDADAAQRGPEAYTPASSWTRGEVTHVPVTHMPMEVHPAHVIRDLDVVEQVVRHFAARGELDPSRTWYQETWMKPIKRPWTLTSTTDVGGSTFAAR